MAISGEQFLRLNRQNLLICTHHALQRIEDVAGREMTGEEVTKLFLGARQVKQNELVLMGYRPNYHGRLKRGVKSWYFRATVGVREVVFVVSEDPVSGELVWVTTYTRNRQTDQLSVFTYNELCCVA